MQLQRSTIRRITIGVACVSLARSASAQWGFWPADSLLAAGRLSQAESAYYAASRARPKDPATRAALGRYLAARGAVKVGAVLVEEAQFFGGDSAALSRVLVPMYVRSSNYGKLDSLRPANVLSAAERKRVHWLVTRPPLVRLGDTVVVLTYRPLANGDGLGTMLLRVGKSEWPAVLDPRVSGLQLPEAARGDLRTFGKDGKETLSVADVVRLGGVMLTNVPAVIGDPDTKVRVGFDVIAPYYPSFDPRAGLMTLRRVGRKAPVAPNATRVPALFDGNGLRLLLGDHWQPTSAAMASMLLGTRRWMWDDRRGDVLLLNDGAAARP